MSATKELLSRAERDCDILSAEIERLEQHNAELLSVLAEIAALPDVRRDEAPLIAARIIRWAGGAA